MSEIDNHVPVGCSTLDLPPLFAAVTVAAHAFEAARRLAAGGGEAGTLVVAADAATLDVAVLLEPDRPAAACLPALPIAMLAMADALAALGPPLKPLGFVWPQGFVLDGAGIGGARLALPEPAADGLPPWLVVGLDVRLRLVSEVGEPGRTPEQTALAEEGFGELTPKSIVGSFARHLMRWVHRWQTEGLAPAAAHYRARLVEPDGKLVRVDPASFDLVWAGTAHRREGLADRLFAGQMP